MRPSDRLWLAITTLLLSGIVVALLSSCDLPLAQPTSVPGAPTNTPGPPSDPTAAPTEGADATPAAPSTITLTIWTTESFSPTQAITNGQILAQAVEDFEAGHPETRVEFILKKPYGKGGILDFLLTTEAVVPALLPDLVLVDVDELDAAIQAGIAQPLDDLISPDLVTDLYPFARAASTFDGQLYGLQFQADLDHLAYNAGQLTVPPRSWPGVLSNPEPYTFPAGGQAGLVNNDFLTQYLAVRPWPADGDPDGTFLEFDSLTAVLQYYQDGVSRGVFPTDILNYHSTDDSWRTYLTGDATLTHVSAHDYLADRDQLPSTAMAPIPAINGAGAPISRGWALALIASDPTRQSLAVEFMNQLMSPQTNADWNKAAGYLPTRQAALALWDEEDSYTRFTSQQLQTAQPRPRLVNYTQVAAALQEAVEAIISGSATPEEAAAQAIDKVQ
ncbi:MAG: extracellular solute-binding protein [Anaerolineae bacterium]|jgi:multiple sugar transport system substrate-binding protein